MIAPTAIIRGVGITFGIPLVEVEGATGYYDSNLDGKATKAAELLKSGEYDFGFVHVKATDDAGHDKNHNIKVEQLEKCDRMVSTFIKSVENDKNHEYIVVVTGDHTTPTLDGDHTYEPVPITMSYVSNVLGTGNALLEELKDDVERFDEVSCGEGHNSLLGRYPSIYTMPTILRLRDKFWEVQKYYDSD